MRLKIRSIGPESHSTAQFQTKASLMVSSVIYYLHCGNCIYIEIERRKDLIVWSHAIVISSVLLKFNYILLLHKCNMLDFIIIFERQKFRWISHTNLYTHSRHFRVICGNSFGHTTINRPTDRPTQPSDVLNNNVINMPKYNVFFMMENKNCDRNASLWGKKRERERKKNHLKMEGDLGMSTLYFTMHKYLCRMQFSVTAKRYLSAYKWRWFCFYVFKYTCFFYEY